MIVREVVPIGSRPVLHERKLCPEWKGGWLKLKNTRGECSVPMECGKNYCAVCGKRQEKRIIARVIRSVQICFGRKTRTTMWTFTFRARRRGETADEFAERTPAVDIAGMPAMEQLRVGHQYFRDFLKEYEERWGKRLDYFRTWEWTKQGVIHYHALVVQPPAVNRGTWQLWAKRAWARVTGEPNADDRIEHGLHCGHPAGKGLASAAGYIAKYITKDYSARAGGEGLQKGVRRMSKSDSLVWQAAGDLDKFVTQDGEIHDERKYKQAYGKAYYHCIQRKEKGKFITAKGWRWLIDYQRRKIIKDKTLLRADVGYDENAEWTDPPEMFILVVQHWQTLKLTSAKEY